MLSVVCAALAWTPPMAGAGRQELLRAAPNRVLLPHDGVEPRLLRTSQPEMMPIGVPKVCARLMHTLLNSYKPS